MKYAFITENKPPLCLFQKPVTAFPSAAPDTLKHRNTHCNRDKQTEQEQKTVQAFHLHKGLYGYRKVYHYLLQSGMSCSLEQVRRLLRQRGLKSGKTKLFKPVTTITDSAGPCLHERVFEIGKTKLDRA